MSEKIALGQKVTKSKDAMYDTRLYAHSSDTSAGAAFDIYSKPLFNRGAQGIYRPKVNEADLSDYSGNQDSLLEKDTGKYKADRGFQGTESTRAGGNNPYNPRVSGRSWGCRVCSRTHAGARC